jgi:hypothetical protein
VKKTNHKEHNGNKEEQQEVPGVSEIMTSDQWRESPKEQGSGEESRSTFHWIWMYLPFRYNAIGGQSG